MTSQQTEDRRHDESTRILMDIFNMIWEHPALRYDREFYKRMAAQAQARIAAIQPLDAEHCGSVVAEEIKQ